MARRMSQAELARAQARGATVEGAPKKNVALMQERRLTDAISAIGELTSALRDFVPSTVKEAPPAPVESPVKAVEPAPQPKPRRPVKRKKPKPESSDEPTRFVISRSQSGFLTRAVGKVNGRTIEFVPVRDGLGRIKEITATPIKK